MPNSASPSSPAVIRYPAFSVLGERPGGLAGVVKRGELADALVGEVDGRVKAQVEGLLGQAFEEALERVEVALHESAQRERLAAEHDFAAFLPWRRADRQVPGSDSTGASFRLTSASIAAAPPSVQTSGLMVRSLMAGIRAASTESLQSICAMSVLSAGASPL